MSHEIFGNRFISVREPAWHQLGTIVDQAVTAEEALNIAGLDYDYHKVPIYAELPDGTTHAIDRYAVMREPTSDDNQWRDFGIVSDNYSVMPNAELAAGLDSLAEASGWTFETAGALDKGRRIFMTLATGSRSVRNDQFDSYVVVTDSKGTGESLQILLAPTRVVCHNTLVMAKNASQFNIRLRHNASLKDDYQFWVNIVHKLDAQQDILFTKLDSLSYVKITDEQFKDFANQVYPLPEKSPAHQRLEDLGMEVKAKIIEDHEYWVERQKNSQKALNELYQRFNDSDENQDTRNSEVAGTAYAALQAAVELADWGGRNSKTATQSALFGARANVKQRAWSAAEGLA